MSNLIRSFSPGVHVRSGKQDCTVRSLANVKDISYYEAYDFMSKIGGRKANQGLYDINLYNAYAIAGAKKIIAYGPASEIRSRYLLDDVRDSVIFESTKIRISVSHAIRTICASGSHIVATPGHAFCVKDGKIYDTVQNSGTSFVNEIYAF